MPNKPMYDYTTVSGVLDWFDIAQERINVDYHMDRITMGIRKQRISVLISQARSKLIALGVTGEGLEVF